MLASVFIIVVSVALFVYWFRYTCLLILSARTAKDYAQAVAAANQLSFLDVRSRLNSAVADASALSLLDEVHRSLERDYRLLVYLLEHVSTSQMLNQPLEHTVLRFDYWLMRTWYRVARSFSGAMARSALLEMAAIVNYFANAMGQRIAVSARA